MNFPEKGLSFARLAEKLEARRQESNLDEAAVLRKLGIGHSRRGHPDLQAIVDFTLHQFLETNALYPPTKGVNRMEQEIISMMGSLWGLSNPHGTMTAGGTESNILAMYVAVKAAKGKRGNVILPRSAHPSLFKACRFLGLNPIIAPLKENFTVDPNFVRKAVTNDTIAIVGSCGCVPWGMIDPIVELGEIAEEKSLYLHVDGSWGGPICPWLKFAGFDVPQFDFSVNGVSSLCGDPHKLGFSIYPAGVMIFRNEELLNLARFRFEDVEEYKDYSSPGLLGSRPGSSIAVTWALFNYLGKEGYIELSKKCMDLALGILDIIERQIPSLQRAVTPQVNIANIMSTKINMDLVKQKLRDRNWFFFQATGKPFTREDTLTLATVPYHEKAFPAFLEDLKTSVAEVST